MVGRVDHRLAPGSTRTFALLERIASVGPRQFALCYPGIEIEVVEAEPLAVETARARQIGDAERMGRPPVHRFADVHARIADLYLAMGDASVRHRQRMFSWAPNALLRKAIAMSAPFTMMFGVMV
jgi:hypothetical protein